MNDDGLKMKWWRGCKPDHDEPLGCTQHKFNHGDQEYVVDECVCKETECNKEMGPIPTDTTTAPTTTPKGKLDGDGWYGQIKFKLHVIINFFINYYTAILILIA